MECTEIGIVAACSHAKTKAAAEQMHARTLASTSTVDRAAEWLERVRRTPGELPASMLYCGVYWSGVVDLWRKTAVRQRDSQLWIMSAGYGLIPSSAVIASYAATLSPRETDSVLARPGPLEPMAWWSTLASWSGPQSGAPRSLVDLAAAYPKTAWIVVAGSNYISAASADFAQLDGQGMLQERFYVVSPGLSGRASLPAHIDSVLLHADSRWEERLGRGKVSIGVRIAAELFRLAEGDPARLQAARMRMQREGTVLSGMPMPVRTPMDDAKVRQHLEHVLGGNPTIPFTRALRDFRDAGNACEYKRFRALYQQVRQDLHGET
jgi:hypothetical protein